MNDRELTLGARLFAFVAVTTPVLFVFLFGFFVTQSPGDKTPLSFTALGDILKVLVLVGAAWSFVYVTRTKLLNDRERTWWQVGSIVWFLIAPQVVWFKLVRHDPDSFRVSVER